MLNFRRKSQGIRVASSIDNVRQESAQYVESVKQAIQDVNSKRSSTNTMVINQINFIDMMSLIFIS